MTDIVIKFHEKPITYTGAELRPHFLLSELGLRGSAIGAFIGPCRVTTEKLVDWEDRLANDRIESKLMLHFIGEFFGISLKEGVLLQRLFMAIIRDSLDEFLNRKNFGKWSVTRLGDDIFIGTTDGAQRKLSVSIVTASPVSQLLHIGVNIDPSGAPVPAIGLGELGVSPVEWVKPLLESFAQEYGSVNWACTKVRPVM